MEEKQKIINRKNFSSDSRLLKKGEIFFDLESKDNQDSKYLGDAIKKKPLLIISQNKNHISTKNFYIVKNIKSFFENKVNQKFNKKPKYKVAVTGTNGKSSVAYYYYTILRLLKYNVASIGTLGIFENRKKKNIHLTTPSFLDNHKIFNSFYKKKINHCIIEASSHGLKQSRLKFIKFHCGIFTNLTRDHLDYHKTMKDYFNSKLILLKKLIKKKGFVIFSTDIKEFDVLKKISIKKNLNILSYGFKGNVIKIISTKIINQKTKLKINVLGKIYVIMLNLVGTIQIQNLLCAILALYSCGISFNKIFSSCSKIYNPPGRMQIVKNKKKIVIIDYAHTPDALQKTINEAKSFFNKKANLVFGCGGDRDKGKRGIMGKIANKLCKKIYITDDNPRYENPAYIRNEIKKNCSKGLIIPSRKKAIQKAISDLKDEVLIIAGKGHENYQIFKNKKINFSDYKFANIYSN